MRQKMVRLFFDIPHEGNTKIMYSTNMKKEIPIQALQRALSWYSTDQSRDLPWRKTRDAYAIWVSEIMLQQTQASRVIEYYHQFLQKFPTVASLASSTWEKVLPYWRGLGFYGRGKRMIETAKIITSTYHGTFPQNEKELKDLPGIGPYTAAAIASFAYDSPVPALDTNLNRVLHRLFHWPKKQIEKNAQQVWPHMSDPVALNHALMDIGNLFCLSQKCICKKCPFVSVCDFSSRGCPLPKSSKKTISKRPKGKTEVVIALLHKNNTYLIGKRPDSKGGLWEFIGGKVEPGEHYRAACKREVMEEIEVEVSVRPPLHEEETKKYWLRFCRCQILKGTPKKIIHDELQWIRPSEFETYSFPEGNTKIIEMIQDIKH